MPIASNIDINSTISDYSKAGEHLYLLVEGAGSKPVPRERLFADSDGLMYIPIYIDTDYESILKVSPLLVVLEETGEFFDWFVNEGPAYHAGVIIASRHESRVVLRHLQGMVEVKMPNYNLAAFRYQDPTVLDRYLAVTDDKAQERLLGPLTAMLWPKEEWVKPQSGQGPIQEWRWQQLYSADRPGDEEDQYLQPQPPIEITKEQVEGFELYQRRQYAEHISATLF